MILSLNILDVIISLFTRSPLPTFHPSTFEPLNLSAFQPKTWYILSVFYVIILGIDFCVLN
jgi:hypothetical protein